MAIRRRYSDYHRDEFPRLFSRVPSQDFCVGDVVELKSGSVPMSVTGFGTDGVEVAYCDFEGRFHSDRYPADALKLSEDPQESE